MTVAVLTTHYAKLSWRAKRFVDHLVDLESQAARDPKHRAGLGAEAMRAIGFMGKRPDCAAHKFRRRPGVREAIEERRAMVAEAANLTSVEVIHLIRSTIDRCQQAEPVLDRRGNQVLVENGEGKLVPAYVFDAKSVLKGAELLGSYLKMFTQKHEHTGADGGPIQTQEVVIFDDGGPGEPNSAPVTDGTEEPSSPA